MSLNLKPLGNRLVVEPIEQEEVTAGGIVLPETAKEKPQMGVVMAVGAGSTDDKGKKVKIVVKTGDKVMYKKWGGNEIKVEGKEWMIVEQKDILAIVE